MAQSSIGSSAFAFLAAFVRFARWRALVAGLLIALGALFEGMGLLLLVPVLEVVTAPAGGTLAGGSLLKALALPLQGYGQTGRLLILLAVFAALMAARSLVLATRDRAINRLRLEFVEQVRMDLVEQLAATPWQDVVRLKHARIVQALSVELQQIGDAANAAMRAAVALVMLGGYCVLALILAPLAGGLALACTLGAALIGHSHLRRARRLGVSIVQAQTGMTDGALMFLGALKLATAQGLQSRFVAEYGSASTSATRDQVEFLRHQTRLANATSTASALIAAATLFAGIVVFHLEPAVLITLLLLLSRMSAPAMVLQQGAQEVLHRLPAFEAIRELDQELDRSDPVKRTAPVLAAAASTGEALAFRDVTFRHPGAFDGPPTLCEVSLSIPAGAFVGIAGPSGAGKTTFLDLAAGLLVPQSGRVLSFGSELAGATLERRRAQLAYVAQDPFLFDDTIRRNLQWSRPGCADDEMLEALGLAGADQLVARLDRGLDTRIGERGVLFSAGERQRLALARAILRRPTLLILDEATNAIDIEGEQALLEALASLTPETTILMVAHRPQSLRLCDHFIDIPGFALTTRPSQGARASR